MKKLFYPALFHKAEEGGFWVTFPDIPECMTEGDDLSQAYEMAVDALGLSLTSMEETHISLPIPSTPDTIETPDNSFLVVIEFDMLAYKKKHCSRAVKKTLSIPEWLNDAALEMNINFSQVLQEALIQKIKLSSNQ
ncbi:MAG: type II toxin-antitoxin system HicB family antitoxin [Roseburia sp.]|nr:type II toxin-antitoxin system HicB family antitoxin [Roseburia sp.]